MVIKAFPRVIPILLLRGHGLYKTRQFKEPKYIGDPVNAVRIFNEKEVDELTILDIDASRGLREPNILALREIAAEAFMPLSFGGGVSHCDVIHALVTTGYERVIVNSAAVKNPGFVDEAVEHFGTSTLIAAIDAHRDWLGRSWVYIHGGQEKTKLKAGEWAAELERRGAGEILLTSIDRDGEMNGYDVDLVREVVGAVNIPVIASGGAGKLADFANANSAGASAVAAGAFFVFHGKHRAVLISYPSRNELMELWAND